MTIKKTLILIASFFLFLSSLARPVFGDDAYLFLSPTTGSYNTNFNLEVRINTGGQEAGGVDVYLEFPQDLLKVNTVTKGNAFSEVNSLILNDQGKLRLTGYFPIDQASQSFNDQNGLVATLNVSPLKNGSAIVNFICTPGATNDSNIVEKSTNQEIINCQSNLNGTYQLTSSGPTNTPPSTTTTPPVPVSGTIAQTIGLTALGLMTFLVGLIWAF